MRNGISRDHGVGPTRPELMIDDHAAQRAFDAAQRVIVKRHLGVTGRIGNHDLNRIAVPRGGVSVLMVVVSNDHA
jgi:hypothetical protein